MVCKGLRGREGGEREKERQTDRRTDRQRGHPALKYSIDYRPKYVTNTNTAKEAYIVYSDSLMAREQLKVHKCTKGTFLKNRTPPQYPVAYKPSVSSTFDDFKYFVHSI